MDVWGAKIRNAKVWLSMVCYESGLMKEGRASRRQCS